MAPMTAERRAVLEKRLIEAESAMHDVAIGGMARVFVDQNGERIEYGPTNMGQLNKYIFGLKAELGVVSGPAEPWA